MKSAPILLYISIVVFAGVMIGIIPALFVLVLMILSMFTLNRHEIIVALTFAFVPVLGMAFSHYNIGIPSSLVCLLTVLLFSFKEIGKIIKNNRRPITYIFALWAIMLAYYFITGRTENSSSKIVVMSELVILYSLAVFILSSAKDIRFDKIAPFLLMSGVFIVAAAHDYSSYPAFSGLFDFDTIRSEFSLRKRNLDEGGVSYQKIGMQVICAEALFLSASKKFDFNSFFLLFVCSWIALVSGSRQAILGVLVIFGAWIILKNGKGIKKGDVVLSIIALFVLILGLSTLELDIFSDLFQSDSSVEESTGRDYLYPLAIIQSNLLFGVGFGNYENPFIDGEVYPHNLFLEILCEMGIIGLAVISIVIITWYINEKPVFMQRVNSGGLAALIVLPFLIRSMISDDLSYNFVLFVLVFTLFAKRSNNFQVNNGKL
jgi:O-antigen ligase